MTKKINTIIFDVGKVLVDWTPIEHMKNLGYDEDTIAAVDKAMFSHPIWDEHDRGVLTDDAYLQQFIANAPEYEAQIRLAHNRDGEAIHTYDYSRDWVRSLKEKGYHLYILSNYSHNTYIQTESKMTFLPYMDGSIFSFQVQKRKPYLCIYQTLLERYNLEPAQCVFIDDRKENITAAESLGIHGIVFRGYKDAVEQLKTYGVQ